MSFHEVLNEVKGRLERRETTDIGTEGRRVLDSSTRVFPSTLGHVPVERGLVEFPWREDRGRVSTRRSRYTETVDPSDLFGVPWSGTDSGTVQ